MQPLAVYRQPLKKKPLATIARKIPKIPIGSRPNIDFDGDSRWTILPKGLIRSFRFEELRLAARELVRGTRAFGVAVTATGGHPHKPSPPSSN